MMERIDVVLTNEGVRIPSYFVAHVQYEKETSGPRKWVRVVRHDGAELIFPISVWEDVTVDDLGDQYFVVNIKVDWNGTRLAIAK